MDRHLTAADDTECSVTAHTCKRVLSVNFVKSVAELCD